MAVPGDTWLFASELKALARHPAFEPQIDRDALALFVQHNYIPTPRTIYRGVKKLRPGSWITLQAGKEDAQPVVYWDLGEKLSAGRPFEGDEQDACHELDRILQEATRVRMRADVPWGAFLSGGIDSSLVVAAMQSQSAQPVHTFSIGFESEAFDEAPFARAVARHLGTEHTEHYVTAAEARDVIPLLPAMYDEPFCRLVSDPDFLGLSGWRAGTSA